MAARTTQRFANYRSLHLPTEPITGELVTSLIAQDKLQQNRRRAFAAGKAITRIRDRKRGSRR